MKTVLGIIGGSGIYDVPMEDAHWETIASPWGHPSDQVRRGTMAGLDVVFLPRHGRGHRYSPSTINYRANIDALKRAGVTDLLSFSAVGSLQETSPPGSFVVPDQFIDRTSGRASSFFGDGCVAHVPFAHPVSPLLENHVAAALAEAGVAHRRGGVHVVIEGPQFSTRAESLLYRLWGCSIVGMTAMPEAKLAREAEMSWCGVSMVTDFDAWHSDHAAVTVDMVVAAQAKNAASARFFLETLTTIMPRIHEPCPVGSNRALDGAIMTAPNARDPARLAKLDAVAGRVLKTPA